MKQKKLFIILASLGAFFGCSNNTVPTQPQTSLITDNTSSVENDVISSEGSQEVSSNVQIGNNNFNSPNYTKPNQTVTNYPKSSSSGQIQNKPNQNTSSSGSSSQNPQALRPATSSRNYESAWDQMSPYASYKEFTDPRDGTIYRAIEINGTIWMAENVNYVMSGSDCPDYESENCAVYGRLYTWDAASRACPSGWRIPSLAEWQQLSSYAKVTALKSSIAWNGNNATGFSALPSGRITCHGEPEGGGEWAGFWASTTRDGAHDRVHLQNTSFTTGVSGSDYQYSVRCIFIQ